MLAVLLNLIHHIQTLLYLPTIIAIVVVRFYLVQRRRISLADVLLGGGLLALIGGLFLYTQLYGNVPVPREEFTAYLQSRISDPAFRSYLSTDIYYNTLAKEISHTWTILPKNLRLPVYAAINACHAPLIACFLNSMRQLDTGSRRFILVALTLITSAYLIVFAIVFDYARWYSNWATCMILMFFTMQYLATTRSFSIADTARRTAFRMDHFTDPARWHHDPVLIDAQDLLAAPAHTAHPRRHGRYALRRIRSPRCETPEG